MKILILKNKGVNEKFVEKQIKSLDYFGKLKSLFGIDNIPYTLEEADVDIDIKVSKKGKATDGTYGYTLKEIPDIPEGYDFVLFCYDGVPVFNGGGNYAYTRPEPINGAYIAEVPDSSKDNVFTHELIHLFAHKLKGLGYPATEQMDATKIDGKWIPYYKNNTPEAKLGNYHVSLLALKPYLPYLSNTVGKLSLLETLLVKLKELQAQLALQNSKPKYKNFSELEVKGLDHEFVLLLDKARDIAGVPFVINSGFRTVAHNAKVGGVKDSAHLSGKAVDLRARNGAEAYAIIKSAMDVGIKRIGVNRKSNFIHLDVDTSKPSPTVYEY